MATCWLKNRQKSSLVPNGSATPASAGKPIPAGQTHLKGRPSGRPFAFPASAADSGVLADVVLADVRQVGVEHATHDVSLTSPSQLVGISRTRSCRVMLRVKSVYQGLHDDAVLEHALP